jgi:hypothetical protein
MDDRRQVMAKAHFAFGFMSFRIFTWKKTSLSKGLQEL